MLHALPDDGNRYELIDGELLVSPAPSWTHQRVLARLFERLAPYARAAGHCEVLFAPGAVQFNERRELQPDLTGWRFSSGPDGAADRAPARADARRATATELNARSDARRRVLRDGSCVRAVEDVLGGEVHQRQPVLVRHPGEGSRCGRAARASTQPGNRW